jgi:crossover junction endodeoxyribonuclease RuvC
VIVLGIDPGTAALGYGIVDGDARRVRPIDHGVVTTTAADGLPHRLRIIHERLLELIDRHRPDLVGVERLFFSRNAQTAFAIGQARGVVLLAAAERDVPIREATPSEVKSAVAGDGAADKAQVARMVQVVLGLDAPPTPDDAADALAVAICILTVETGMARRADGRLDLAAAASREAGGRSGYERAVQEALAAERTASAGRATPPRPRPTRP